MNPLLVSLLRFASCTQKVSSPAVAGDLALKQGQSDLQLCVSVAVCTFDTTRVACIRKGGGAHWTFAPARARSNC